MKVCVSSQTFTHKIVDQQIAMCFVSLVAASGGCFGADSAGRGTKRNLLVDLLESDVLVKYRGTRLLLAPNSRTTTLLPMPTGRLLGAGVLRKTPFGVLARTEVTLARSFAAT